MSGIEVVGIVLGILPLAIEALKGYRSMLSRLRGVDRDLKALVQDLETEEVRLRTTCEVLIDGIAPLFQIDSLVETPFGPEWDQFSDDIRVRLWTAMPKVKEQAKEMQEAAEELKAKLLEAIREELRQKASFSLKKKDYDSIIYRIKTANSVLHDLIGQNCRLEPSRRQRSQARVTKLIRGLSRSIFDALRSSAACRCVRSHDVCLELVPRKAVLVPSDVEEEVAKDINFHVVLGSHESPATDSSCSDEDAGTEKGLKSLERLTRWDSLRIQFEPKTEPQPPPQSLSIPNHPKSQPSRRRVRFSESFGFMSRREGTSSSTETLAVVSEPNLVIATALATATGPPVLESDLCQVVLTWHEEPREAAMECCGYITDPHRRFGLYPQHRYPESSSTVTLRQMLGGKDPEFLKIDLLEKLRVALAISISVLHLYNTPWLAQTLNLDDIRFLRGNQKSSSHLDFSLRPFVAKNLVKNSHGTPLEAPQSKPRKSSKATNLTVLSLGAMLIQVIIGQVVPALDMAADADMDLNEILEKHEAGGKFGDKVLQSGGINYMAAVRWCLESVLGIMGPENEEFCQNFYEEVVARLEKDIQQLSS
ncbi:hypothetical protein AK830_g11964 [Neonectria ditissima]|uniref:DUF7580 domain-containing protein n=1 Tax=Neonectria ditissima TaxID=78410 RepID=A0A0P7AKZ7_9HYPO|nr:hypothetical protein AK830_g11964 [Neonectria ditissima]